MGFVLIEQNFNSWLKEHWNDTEQNFERYKTLANAIFSKANTVAMDIYRSFSNPIPLNRRSRSLPKSKYSSLLCGDEKLTDSTKRSPRRKISQNDSDIGPDMQNKPHSEYWSRRDSIQHTRYNVSTLPDDESTQSLLNPIPDFLCNRKQKTLGRIASLSPSRGYLLTKEKSARKSRKLPFKNITVPLKAPGMERISHLNEANHLETRMDEIVQNNWSSKKKSASLDLSPEPSHSLERKVGDMIYSPSRKHDGSMINYLQLRFERDKAIVDYITAPSPEVIQSMDKKKLCKMERKKESNNDKDKKRDRAVSIMNSAA
jgi:hypothetical protein